MINLKYDIKKMIEVGKIASKTLEMIKQFIKPGISTEKLNEICNNFIISQKGKSAILNYMGFPKSVCISVNNIACHGIPSDLKIKHGDILNIDVAVKKDGFYSDTSKMFMVEKTSNLAKKICYISKKSLYLAINILKPGLKIKEIGRVIQNFVESNGFSVVKEYCGHGIGKKLHDNPYILHYYLNNKNDIILEPGMCITIEPIINAGNNKVIIMEDGWTVKTKDNSLSAQYEHTVIITNKGFLVTTARSNEIF